MRQKWRYVDEVEEGQRKQAEGQEGASGDEEVEEEEEDYIVSCLLVGTPEDEKTAKTRSRGFSQVDPYETNLRTPSPEKVPSMASGAFSPSPKEETGKDRAKGKEMEGEEGGAGNEEKQSAQILLKKQREAAYDRQMGRYTC